MSERDPRQRDRMHQSSSDADVIRRVLDGDTEAFGVLVDRYQHEFGAYAKYMTGSMDDAADAVQETFIRAFKSLRRCRDRERFKGWLFRILTNQCKTHLARRRRRRHEPLFGEAAALPAAETADGDTEITELRRKVHDALQALPIDQREVLVLKYVHGMGLGEMTEILSTGKSALKMRLLRGRQALREKLRGVAL